MLEARSLRKVAVPAAHIQDPSPGGIQSTRLALHVSDDDTSCCAYIASGCSIYTVQIRIGDSLVNRGKDGLLIPVQGEVIDSSVVDGCPHQSEIQSIALAAPCGTGCQILGSVDSHGHLIVSMQDASGKVEVQKPTYSVSPQDCGIREGSWAGLSFSPSQWSLAAVAHCFNKSIDVYDQEVHLRGLRTLWYPTSLSFVQNQFYGAERSILAITEGCQLSLWDFRMKENGGCLQRICGSRGNILYAICASSTGNIAVGGADRTVSIYDPRRWSAISRLVHWSKHEITGLAFSSIDSNCIYVQGVDNEVFCGQWAEAKRIFSFRGDSNWLGFAKCADKEVLGGWCDSGSLLIADIGTKEEEVHTLD